MNFDLLYNIIHGKWMIRPEYAISQHILIDNILNHRAVSDGDIIKKTLKHVVASSDGLNELSDYHSASEKSTAIISFSGTMVKYDGECSYGMETVASFIQEAAMSDEIDSIVLCIDSPGGAVNAVSPVTDAIDIAHRSGKPVIACCDLCCSAAYLVACHCDAIMASNALSAEFGSIGVMCSIQDVKPFYEKQGYRFHEVYSSHSSDKNAAFNDVLEGKYDLIRSEQLDPLAVKFQDTVRQKRKDLKEEPGVLTGKEYFAEESLRLGLIDAIGPLSDAVALAKKFVADYTIHTYLN